MSTDGVKQEANDEVGLFLMGSGEADAVVEQLRERLPSIDTEWRGAYWAIRAPQRIDIDLKDLGERIGRDVEISDFLVVLSSYYGRIVIGDSTFSVVTEIDPKD
jgi:hypothetical protein